MHDPRGDVIVGTGVDGTTEPIDRPDQDRSGEEYGRPTLPKYTPGNVAIVEHFGLDATSESTESGQEAGLEPQAEIEPGDEEQVFGISFPASMLPLNFNYGYWESEPILDPNGDPEAALVRVWLYPPNQPGDPMISDESSSEGNTPQETEGTS